MVKINNFISLALIVLSAIFLAFGSFVRKYMVSVDGIYISMLVCFAGGAIVMWWVVSISTFNKIMPKAWRSILIRAMFAISAQALFFISLSNDSLLITVLLFNTSPLFIPLIRFLFHKQSVSYFNLGCIVVSFFGMYMILGAGATGVNLYALCALFAGILNAASQVVLHGVSQKEDAIIINLWVYTFVAVVLVVLFPLNMPSAANIEDVFVQPAMVWVCISIIIKTVDLICQ